MTNGGEETLPLTTNDFHLEKNHSQQAVEGGKRKVETTSDDRLLSQAE